MCLKLYYQTIKISKAARIYDYYFNYVSIEMFLFGILLMSSLPFGCWLATWGFIRASDAILQNQRKMWIYFSKTFISYCLVKLQCIIKSLAKHFIAYQCVLWKIEHHAIHFLTSHRCREKFRNISLNANHIKLDKTMNFWKIKIVRAENLHLNKFCLGFHPMNFEHYTLLSFIKLNLEFLKLTILFLYINHKSRNYIFLTYISYSQSLPFCFNGVLKS